MAHFTYVDNIDLNSLKQGDVIKKTEHLSNIIQEVHPYFKESTYTHFLILTQSCDLVLRDGKCSSRYITIAAIRPLEEAVRRKAKELTSTIIEKTTNQLIGEKTYSKLSDFLTSLLNNNINDYFYLHSEPAFDLIEPSVAFLRVSIALKSELHYDTCLSSKIMELDDSFKAKLGWLVGNLYSRVGTVDWVPGTLEQQSFNSQVKKQLDSYFTLIPNIIDTEKEILKTYNPEQIKNFTLDELIAIVKNIRVQNKKEKIIQQIEEIIVNSNSIKEGYNIAKLVAKMKNDPVLNSLLKTK